MDFELETLKALGNETRIEIIKTLGDQELNVTQISENSSVSRPTISHHLQILKRNRIVNAHRVGKEIYYSVNSRALIKIAENLLNFASKI